MFSKRSTRTRLAGETSIALLGGHSLFLAHDDIQLGVNETLQDSARVISSMTDGIFARVGPHSDIEELAKYSSVPVINALSDLWHPSQSLADLMTLHDQANIWKPFVVDEKRTADPEFDALPTIRPLTVAYVGDSTNILHDMLVSYPRLGHSLRVATPKKYPCPPVVWDKVKALGCDSKIWWGDDPREAVHKADVVVTDTWVSMGQEAEKEQRLKDFQGYQVTEQLCQEGGANPDWKFLHCLPRKAEEVDDNVFYGQRSLVFPEAENRKWTTLALFAWVFGRGRLP